MSEQIAWCVELAIKPGKLPTFQELTKEMVAATAEYSHISVLLITVVKLFTHTNDM